MSSTEPLYLLCRASTMICGLPVVDVDETMRPLPVAFVAGAPPSLRGVAVVRGCAVPVVDVGALLTGQEAAAHSESSRFIVVRTGHRRVALAVREIVGVRRLSAASGLPPLFADGAASLLAMEALDAELLVVLRGARAVSEEAWRVIDASGVRA